MKIPPGPKPAENYPAETASRPPRKYTDLAISLLLLALVLAESSISLRKIGISWDEPGYFRAAKEYTAWARHLNRDSFSGPVLEETFGFIPTINDHPTLGKLLGALTYVAFRKFMPGFFAYRMSAVFIFAALLIAVYLRAARQSGRLAGFASIMALATIPPVFVHCHIAATDAPLCLFWFLGAWAYARACERPGLSWLAGLCYGLCMSVKFTGFFLPVPLLAYGLLYHRRRMLYPSLALLLGPAVFFMLQPELWHAPLAGISRFLEMSLTRHDWNRIWTDFLGKTYDFSPPWYYAPFMTLVTIPELTVIFSLAGIVRAGLNRFRNRLAGESALHFLFFMLITMLPQTPVFDGIRLFLPAMVFLAILSGTAMAEFCEWLARILTTSPSAWLAGRKALVKYSVAGLLSAALLSCLMSIYPYGMEYYNRLIGGVKGARARGMETTYWGTVMNEDTIKELNQLLPKNAVIRFDRISSGVPLLYQEMGWLRSDLRLTKGTDFDYVLILSRPYWNSPRIFSRLGVPVSELVPVKALVVDEVPFYILYRRKAQAAAQE